MAGRQAGGTGWPPRRPTGHGSTATASAKGRSGSAPSTGAIGVGPIDAADRRAAPAQGSRCAVAGVAPVRLARRGPHRSHRRPASERRKPEKTLGGEQVEGRQAVRELLIAGKRRVREVWVVGRTARRRDGQRDRRRHRRDRPQRARPGHRGGPQAARGAGPQRGAAGCHRLRRAAARDRARRRCCSARRATPPFLVAVDGVTDPGNLGALLRCCDGAGVHGVVLPRHRAVHVTPTVAKAAAGAVEHVPMALVGGLPAALARIKDAGIWVVGLDDERRPRACSTSATWPRKASAWCSAPRAPACRGWSASAAT